MAIYNICYLLDLAYYWGHQMTFPAELERLLKEALTEEMSCKYSRFIVNHADAILGLVRAAESLSNQYPEKRDGMDGEILPVGVKGIRYALAKLNGEGNS